MQEWLVPYTSTIISFGVIAALLLIQLVIADIAAIKVRHLPGAPIEANHANFLFRAARAYANTNESITAFILLALLGLLSRASPEWLNIFAWVYVGARLAHMLCYYLNLQLLRSMVFGVGVVALFGMLGVGIRAWF